VEVTSRALHSRLLFCPRPLMNEIIIGTLARAKQRHKVRVCFFVCLGNHMLCRATHNMCYGEWLVMRSWRSRSRGFAGNGGCCCA